MVSTEPSSSPSPVDSETDDVSPARFDDRASSSPSSSSNGSSSSSELNPSDALQSPLTGLLDFEGFGSLSMPQIRNLGIANLDMPNLPSLPTLPTLPSFNMPRIPQRLPNLANNLTANLHNYTPSIPNLPYLSQLNPAELQNMFNLSRISIPQLQFPQLPQLPQLPQFPQFAQFRQFPQLPQIPPLFSAGQLRRANLLKPWTNLRNSVKNMHQRLNDIIECSATNFHFREWNNNDNVRIYFLLNNFIYYCDISKRLDNYNVTNKIQSKKNNTKNHQQPSPSTSSGDVNRRRSKKYDVQYTKAAHPKILVRHNCHIKRFVYKDGRFVFTNGINIFYFNDDAKKNEVPYSPTRIETITCDQPKSDLQICPSNNDLIAYCCGGNIWCVNLSNGKEVRLTNISSPVDKEENLSKQNFNANSDHLPSDSRPVLVGRPTYVIKEEFKRENGYWWRPEPDKLSNPHDAEYQLLYEETDQSMVDIVRINSHDGSIEEQRYPRAGKKNPVSSLKVIKFKLDQENNITDVTSQDLPQLKTIYSDYEYLIRAGWYGQDCIWCQLLNRRQTHLVLVLISLNKLFEPQIIYEDRRDMYWVGTHDNIFFLNCNRGANIPLAEGSDVKFIWSSQETGFRHLYHVHVKISSKNLTYTLVSKSQLTEGQWEVSDKDIWIDEYNMLIYFCGLRDTPLENHLYVVSYAPSKCNHFGVRRLTEPDYSHSSIAFNSNCTIFVNIQSNISCPPFGFVNKIIRQKNKHSKKYRANLPDAYRLASLLINSFNYPFFDTLHKDSLKSIGTTRSILYDTQTDLLPGLARPELFCCQLTSGELIYGAVFKPEFMESGLMFPTILEVYGGPEMQMVTNSFLHLRQPIRHLLSSEGYVVVIIDCRGSGKRGLRFEAHTYHQMGQVEIADQIEVLQWLAKNTGYIDLNRVAIKGWSYGGYLALMGLAHYPKVFKVAIAGAPVTNWNMYDSAYTERFMGLPSENQDGYHKGSVMNYVKLLPDDGNRLLLLHGMMDENVHFSHHTISLINALLDEGKPYDIQVYPTERHLLKNLKSQENYYTCLLSYLQLNL